MLSFNFMGTSSTLNYGLLVRLSPTLGRSVTFMVDRMGTESRPRVDFSEEIYTRELTRGDDDDQSADDHRRAPSLTRELVVIL